MDAKTNKEKEYHIVVWNKSKQEARNYIWADRRTLYGNIILAVASGFITTRVLDFWSQTVVIPSIIQFIAIFLGAVVGFFALYVYRLFSNVFWFVPADIYRKKEVEANKFTWNDVSIEIPKMPDNYPLPVCLVVSNEKPYDIEKAFVKLSLVKKGRIIVASKSNILPLDFCWSDDGPGTWTGKTLRKNKEEISVLSIANWLYENRGVFLFASTMEKVMAENAAFIELIKNENYIIELRFFGEIESRKMDEYKKSYSLRFDDTNMYLEEIKFDF